MLLLLTEPQTLWILKHTGVRLISSQNFLQDALLAFRISLLYCVGLVLYEFQPWLSLALLNAILTSSLRFSRFLFHQTLLQLLCCTVFCGQFSTYAVMMASFICWTASSSPCVSFTVNRPSLRGLLRYSLNPCQLVSRGFIYPLTVRDVFRSKRICLWSEQDKID